MSMIRRMIHVKRIKPGVPFACTCGKGVLGVIYTESNGDYRSKCKGCKSIVKITPTGAMYDRGKAV